MEPSINSNMHKVHEFYHNISPRDTERRQIHVQYGEGKTIFASLKYLHYIWKVHHLHLSLCGPVVLKPLRLTWMKVSGNWTKTERKTFDWTVPGAINWRILLLDYNCSCKCFLSRLLLWKQLKKKGWRWRWMGLSSETWERVLKRKNHNICGLWVVCESNWAEQHFLKLGRKQDLCKRRDVL